MEEDINCREIWDSIEQDTAELLKKDISEKMKANMLEAIQERVQLIHNNLDLKSEQFINNIIGTFKEQEVLGDKEDNKNISHFDKKEKKLKELRLAEINLLTDDIEKDFQLQFEDLKDILNKVVRRTSVIDVASDIFKTLDINQLLQIGKDEISIKMPRSISSLIKGKGPFDLAWNSQKNNTSNCSIDTNDPSRLNLNGGTCYTYYQTTPSLTYEDVNIEVEYKLSNVSDDWFYIGVINEKVVPTSNCMCGNLTNAYYFRTSGDLILDAVCKNEPSLKIDKSVIHKVSIKILLSDSTKKELFILMDDKDELGPYTIQGENFTFIAASCSQKSGYIKITNCFYC